MFSSRVSRMDVFKSILNKGESCQVRFVRCSALCGGGRFCGMLNECDVDGRFPCGGDSSLVFGLIESS